MTKFKRGDYVINNMKTFVVRVDGEYTHQDGDLAFAGVVTDTKCSWELEEWSECFISKKFTLHNSYKLPEQIELLKGTKEVIFSWSDREGRSDILDTVLGKYANPYIGDDKDYDHTSRFRVTIEELERIR